MADQRNELERLRKLKRMKELQAKASGTPVQEEPKAPSFLDRLKQLNELTPGVQTMKAVDKIKGAADVVGEKIASLPEQQNVIGELARKSPTATGLLAGAVANAPLAAETVVGAKGLGAGKAALGKAFSAKGIGSQIGELEAAAGVTKQLPSTKALSQALGMKRGSNFSEVANSLEELVDAGVDIPKQVLSDFRVSARKALNSEAFRAGEPRAVLARIKGKADDCI